MWLKIFGCIGVVQSWRANGGLKSQTSVCGYLRLNSCACMEDFECLWLSKYAGMVFVFAVGWL